MHVAIFRLSIQGSDASFTNNEVFLKNLVGFPDKISPR